MVTVVLFVASLSASSVIVPAGMLPAFRNTLTVEPLSLTVTKSGLPLPSKSATPTL